MNAPFPSPAPVQSLADILGAGVQRTMRLLAGSTPGHRRSVRILVYGQSLAKQEWWLAVADDLRRRFPHADLDIRNRSVGGFSTQVLVHAAEQDIYPEYPDLVLLLVTGDHRRYDDLARAIRSRTCAELAICSDPVLWLPDGGPGDDDQMRGYTWSVAMSCEVLPEIAQRYGCAYFGMRDEWRAYLRGNGLQPVALFNGPHDGHFNAHGNHLMAQLVGRRLVVNERLPADDTVREFAVGSDVTWRKDGLELAFEGNRVDVVAAAGNGSATVTIDGKPPSALPDLYSFTRPNDVEGKDWPWAVGAMMRVDRQSPLLLEDWTARILSISDDCATFRFGVTGSKTGEDGEGDSQQRFVSRSGRVVIEPEYWWLAKAHDLTKIRFEPGYEIRWHVRPHFVDRYTAPPTVGPGREYVITLAQGLANAKHVLRLEGEAPIKAIRVFRPPVAQ